MKNIGKLFLVIAITLILVIQAYAQSNKIPDQPEQKQAFVNSAAANFVDKNNNNICDNRGTRSGSRHGTSYVDKNGDGICDNRANVGNKSANQCKYGRGNHFRNGQNRGYRKYCTR
jgi:hypothetical protein